MIVLKNHGQIAKFYERYNIPRPNDLCQLINRTFWVSVALVLLGDLVLLSLMGFVMLFIDPDHWTTFLTLIFTVFAAGMSAIFGCYMFDEWIRKRRESGVIKEEAQWKANIREAYKSWKEKYCPLVGFEE